MKRYLFIGSIEYSAYCLETLFDIGINIIDILCPSQDAAKFHMDYFDLGIIARKKNIPFSYFTKISEMTNRVRENRPDVIFVLGLSQLIPKQILEIPSIGCIGSHPALLPQNRGRHPIIWAIANGLKKSGFTFFWLDENIDSGEIWSQKEFLIDELDDASTVYEKIKKIAAELLRRNIPDLEQGIVKKTPQDDTNANYWRRRGYEDGEIDWRMSSKRIYDLVRALTRPYVGAHCIYNEREVKVWKARIIEAKEDISNIEPGKIIFKEQQKLDVKTGDGVIEILEHNFEPLPEEGDYL